METEEKKIKFRSAAREFVVNVVWESMLATNMDEAQVFAYKILIETCESLYCVANFCGTKLGRRLYFVI